jgi:hypothetical protein
MTREPHHGLRVAAGAAVLLGVWLLGLHVGGLDTGLLFLAPAFMLLLPLLAGRYLGADRLTARCAPVRRAVAAAALHLPRLRVRLVPRGGLLLGCSLAGRAPPLA